MSVRHGLLALLADGPTHGYQLKSSFESRTGGVWTLNVGQVYSTLERLGADGLAEPDDSEEGDRRPWRITESGKAELERWYSDPAVSATPPRDELLMKVLLSLGGSDHAALNVIDRQREAIYAALQAHRRARRQRPAAREGTAVLAADLMEEALVARGESDLRWLDRCETLVEQRPNKET